MPDTFTMPSPKSPKVLRSRCDSTGTSGRVSIVRKKMRSRVVILPSRASASTASYMRNWLALASVSASNDPCRSGVPGRLKAPMSALVVTPTLAE